MSIRLYGSGQLVAGEPGYPDIRRLHVSAKGEREKLHHAAYIVEIFREGGAVVKLDLKIRPNVRRRMKLERISGAVTCADGHAVNGF